MARIYFFKERQSVIRHNTRSLYAKLTGYFVEFIAGYGVKPERVFITMILFFALFSSVFIARFGFSQGILMSAGAFCTFGAGADRIPPGDLLIETLYIIESFTGISILALFVTVLANMWFRDK